MSSTRALIAAAAIAPPKPSVAGVRSEATVAPPARTTVLSSWHWN